ncbi:MAG: SPOR domain-containing protein [Chlorobi bacterium]|nr:SPOR domain-containing protein [Chlorobiota bacterium]
MDRFLNWISFSLSVILLAGCSASGTDGTRTRKPVAEFEKDFGEKAHAMTEKEPHAGGHDVADSSVNDDRLRPRYIERTMKQAGYRVQVFITTNMDQAREKEQEFTQSLRTYPVYKVYDPPYYKIRVGDFQSREEALALKDSLKSAGVEEAWVVRDNVLVVVKEELK